MANDFTALMYEIVAGNLPHLQARMIMPRLVANSLQGKVAEQGDTIDFHLPSVKAATPVVASHNPQAAPDTTRDKVSLVLSEHMQTSFYLTDKQMGEIFSTPAHLKAESRSAVLGLARVANQHIHAQYTGVYGMVGTPGVTPYATTVDASVDAMITLDRQLAPDQDLNLVFDHDAKGNALKLDAFNSAEKTGDEGAVKIEGEIGRKFGLNHFVDHDVVTHTTGAAGTPLVNGAGQSGDTLIVDGFTTKPNAGDVFTIAGDTQTYAVTAATDLNAGESTLTISPDLQITPADNAGLTFMGDHVVNLAFHRNAFAFATRPTITGSQNLDIDARFAMVQDPTTGISLRLEVKRQEHQTKWVFTLLYGAKLVRPQLAVRVAG